MDIQSVHANLKGGYDVAFEGGGFVSFGIDLEGSADAERAAQHGDFIAWIKAGNKPAPWQPSAEEVARFEAQQDRDVVRARIAQSAGDTLSLLGTTSDAGTIAVLVAACFMAALDEETGYKEFRAKANALMAGISGDHDPTEIATSFLSDVASGVIRLPALEKGIVEVLAEVTERGTAVSKAIRPSE
ncbi:hypothetical protein [Planktotalea sp.]|uniref:hypothetical protein n=1 Tax=Planktotalea sp. TaxID=2029877 RepID=UPI003D6B7AED